MKVSKKVSGVEYAIRDIVSAAKDLEKQGRVIDYLNIGDPVQYGFHPPENVKQVYIDAIKQGENYYSPSEGIQELRSAIADKENSKGLSIDADDVLVTNGVSEGLDMVMSSIVEEGDEVLLPGPYYPPYASYIRLHGGIPIEFSVDLENSTPDIADIKSKITPKTVAICLISPNNPTGAVFEENSLKKLIDVANENNLYIICDEIYDQIVFDKKFVGIGKVAGVDNNVEKIQQAKKLVEENDLKNGKFLCEDVVTTKIDDATAILFWFTDMEIIEKMKKKFQNLQDGTRIVTIWGPLPECLPTQVDFPYIMNQTPFKPADLKEQTLAIFGIKCVDFVTAWEYAERYTKAIASHNVDNDRFLTILQSLIIWINAKNLGIACEDDIPDPIKNYMEILKKFFGIEVEHLLNDATLKF